MRSTEVSLLLPTPVNKAALRAFWLAVSLAIAVPATWVIRALGAEAVGSLTTFGLVFAGVVIPVIVRPSIAWTPYRAWNWIIRRFSLRAIRAVTSIAFLLVMRPLSATSEPHQFERHTTSTSWRQRETQSAGTYRSTHYDPNGEQENTWSGLSSWRRKSGHRAVVLLSPFVALIRLLDVDAAASTDTPSDIYTLY